MSFDQFWLAYPRKVAKTVARKSWDKYGLDEKLGEILENLALMKKAGLFNDWKFIPHPATYLNQQRWEDEIVIDDPKPKTAKDWEKFGQKNGIQARPGEGMEEYLQRVRQSVN